MIPGPDPLGPWAAPVLAAVAVVAASWAAGTLPGPPPRAGSGAPDGSEAPGPNARRRPPPRRHGRPPGVSRELRRPGAGLVAVVVGLVAAVAIVLGPAVAVGGAVLVGGARVRAARRHRALGLRLVDAAVPDLVDLFLVAAAAGHPVASCLRLVAERSPAVVRPLLVEAQAAVDRGRPLARALADLGPRLGSLGPALTGALAGSATTKAPLGPALDRVSVLARDRRRREAEARARRLPVTMLFPLVSCVLPAFVLLAVVPLLAASLASLRL